MSVVRRATEADAADIARVQVASWRAAYRGLMPDHVLDRLDARRKSESWRALLTDGSHRLLIAEEQGSTRGFVCLGPCRDPDLDPAVAAEIEAMYVLPEHWRRGVGTRLMTAAFELLPRLGFSHCVLWTLEDNALACAFYEKTGFARDGVRKVHPKSGLVEIRYAAAVPA